MGSPYFIEQWSKDSPHSAKAFATSWKESCFGQMVTHLIDFRQSSSPIFDQLEAMGFTARRAGLWIVMLFNACTMPWGGHAKVCGCLTGKTTVTR